MKPGGGGGLEMKRLFFDDFPVHEPKESSYYSQKGVDTATGRKRKNSHLLRSAKTKDVSSVDAW